ncbi:hypothetical protein FQN49_008365 [Arthroderma sp. PD_2]|nr:hypothetical protein FQN49_008365 [Arthroderma sp. PD_2]
MDAQKAAQKAEVKTAIDAVAAYFEENKDSQSLVIKLPISANARAINESLAHVKAKLSGKALYVFAADSSKVAHGCYITPELTAKGASANEWASAVSGIIGGKAGGKAPVAIGNGTEINKVDEALDEATKYLEKFKL